MGSLTGQPSLLGEPRANRECLRKLGRCHMRSDRWGCLQTSTHLCVHTCSCPYTRRHKHTFYWSVQIGLIFDIVFKANVDLLDIIKVIDNYMFKWSLFFFFSVSVHGSLLRVTKISKELSNTERKTMGKRNPFVLQVNYARVRTINLTKGGNWNWLSCFYSESQKIELCPCFLRCLIPTETVCIYSILSNEFQTVEWLPKTLC